MSGLKPLIEQHTPQNPVVQEKKITREQEIILFQVYLANILLFWGGTLDPEQQKLQDELQISYLQGLKPWDIVEVWLQGMMPTHPWTIVSNDWEHIKIAASCYCNKKKKEGIRSFSCKTWYSKWPFLSKDRWWDNEVLRFYIAIPESHTVQSTRWIPKEALEEIAVLYKQAGEPETSYELVNNLKYWF